MSTTTTQLGMVKNADGEFGWQQDQRDNWDKLDTEAARVANKIDPQHDANGDHRDIVIQGGATLGGVQRTTWPTPGTASQALTDTLANGPVGNIPAGQEFALQNSAGTVKHFAVDEATGQVTKIDLAGMLGNISDPLVHIPFRRANDEVRLSGTQTFTRASTGTYIDPLDGLVKTAAIDTPRFERMADGGVGILLEGASTNRVLHSGDIANASWVKRGTSTAVAGAADPFGGTTGQTVTVGAFQANDIYTTVVGFQANAVISEGIWIKRVSTSGILQVRRTYNGAINLRIDMSLLPDAYVYVTNTHPATITNNNNTASATGQGGIQFSAEAGTISFLHGGSQQEQLPFASSYIPTTTVAVTRAADSLTLSAAGNVPLRDFTALMDMDIIGHRADLWQQALSFTGDINWLLWEDGATTMWAASFDLSGVSIATSPTTADPAAGVVRLGAVSSAGQGQSIADGVLGSAVAVTRGGTPTAVTLGTPIYPLYGHIRNFRIYDRALTASEIAAA